MTGLFEDIAPPAFKKLGQRCQNCGMKYNTWLGYAKHCAICLSKKGIAFNYFIALAGLAVITSLYVILSIPTDWVYDIIMGGYMQGNPHIFSTERINTLNFLMSIWGTVLPLFILLSFMWFLINRTLREKAGGY